jgi:crotonobetainyl-CoA:carnitine CoA-transferase CaiB-like acyl-CoA transferase
VQDCFACRDGGWVAVSVDPARTAALATLTGTPPGGDVAALTAATAGWAAGQTTEACVSRLRQAGLVAAPVLDATKVLAGMGHDWHWAMQTMPDGRLVKGFPFQFDEDPLVIGHPAVPLGTHTRDVLSQVAGLSPSAIAALIESGVAAAAEPTL